MAQRSTPMRATERCVWQQRNAGIAAVRYWRQNKTVTNKQPSIADIARDPLWLADRYDPQHDAVHFRHITRDQHRAATFLTDEYLGKSTDAVIIAREQALSTQGRLAPVHFIFHSAFCCSTLLARALDIPGISMGLKEPVILNDIIGWWMRGGDRHQIGAVLDNALTLLARPFTPIEATIVKPSNLCNGFAEAIMTLRPDARALLVYAPLPIFLGSVARKGMWGRLWVRELMVKQLQQGFIDLGFSDEDYLGFTDLQAAAVGWLAQHALFARMVHQLGPSRIATLDSEAFLEKPEPTMVRLSNLFGLRIDEGAATDIVAGPAFTRHSKFGSDFNRSARIAEQQGAADVHSDEIEKVSTWASIVAQNNGITMQLGCDLLA
jgi:hypothetical protein